MFISLLPGHHLSRTMASLGEDCNFDVSVRAMDGGEETCTEGKALARREFFSRPISVCRFMRA